MSLVTFLAYLEYYLFISCSSIIQLVQPNYITLAFSPQQILLPTRHHIVATLGQECTSSSRAIWWLAIKFHRCTKRYSCSQFQWGR